MKRSAVRRPVGTVFYTASRVFVENKQRQKHCEAVENKQPRGLKYIPSSVKITCMRNKSVVYCSLSQIILSSDFFVFYLGCF
jgi:hypothetical protein